MTQLPMLLTTPKNAHVKMIAFGLPHSVYAEWGYSWLASFGDYFIDKLRHVSAWHDCMFMLERLSDEEIEWLRAHMDVEHVISDEPTTLPIGAVTYVRLRLPDDLVEFAEALSRVKR